MINKGAIVELIDDQFGGTIPIGSKGKVYEALLDDEYDLVFVVIFKSNEYHYVYPQHLRWHSL